MRKLVGLSISRDEDCTQVRDISSAHLAEVCSKLDELKALEGSLERFVTQCDAVCAAVPDAIALSSAICLTRHPAAPAEGILGSRDRPTVLKGPSPHADLAISRAQRLGGDP
ncbi:hypothetical protein MESS2_280007 [Mesorhizobium metallidurans STM 2683]|uniref:Uncharacterized protein n=1 Tax=Mesorhizobium metallidurans STM 2683 TaxID=1297569 RepID=M5EPQ1_9HYPH|nr:hypothetical protein [Mesorhizobium metallidurans]CCV06125.1 hypothetical protein MESS2_280007 [Mesorhizobium metallidurans STM 2683]